MGPGGTRILGFLMKDNVNVQEEKGAYTMKRVHIAVGEIVTIGLFAAFAFANPATLPKHPGYPAGGENSPMIQDNGTCRVRLRCGNPRPARTGIPSKISQILIMRDFSNLKARGDCPKSKVLKSELSLRYRKAPGCQSREGVLGFLFVAG